MPEFIYDIPSERLAFYLSAGAVALVFLGLLFVKPLLRLFIVGDQFTNETISLTTAAFSLFYGLLLGLLTVAAYQNRDRVQTAILNEASAVGAIYSTVSSYPEPYRSDFREMLRDYVLYTIYREWPAHREGKILQGGTNRISALGQWLARYEPDTVARQVMHQTAVQSFESLKEARQFRLNGVTTRIPQVLWYAVTVGAAVNILILLMIRARPLTHFVLGTISAFFLGVIVFVIIALDAPLRGTAGLPATPYEVLWSQQMVWDEPQG